MLLTRAHHATYSFISNNSKKNSDKWAQKIGCDKKKPNLMISSMHQKKQFQNISILFGLILIYDIIHQSPYQYLYYDIVLLAILFKTIDRCGYL